MPIQSLTALQPGDLLGGFRLGDRIGVGGMGEVFRAQNVHTARMLRAIKVIRPDLAANADFRARLLREAEFLDTLDHPNILRVHHIGEDAGVLFLVMELLIGRSLKHLELPPPAKLTVGAVANLVYQGLCGVGHAHQQKIIHRDLKPANLFLTLGGVVKVLDFGIARDGSGAHTQLTPTAQGAPGTPAYYAPEFADGQPASPASDVYAMGICLFELLSGRLPFLAGGGTDAQAMMSLLLQHALKPLPDIRQLRDDIPEGLVTVLLQATAKQPAERFVDAAAFAVALLPFVGQDLGVQLAGLPSPPEGSQTLGPTPVDGADDSALSPQVPGSQTRFALGPGSQDPQPDASATRFALPQPARPSASPPSEKPSSPRNQRVALGIAAGSLLLGSTWLVLNYLPGKTPPHLPPTVPVGPPDAGSIHDLAPTRPPARQLEPPPTGMIALPAGTLHQGRADYDEVSAKDVPVHNVAVQPLAIESTEVSIDSYRDFVLATKAKPPWPASLVLTKHLAATPVTNLSYSDAQAYCRWRYAAQGRLPAESEWEWAARGAAGWLYPWGNEFKTKCANVLNSSQRLLKPVAELLCDQTPTGILGLSGNVREWTSSLPSVYPGSRAKLPPGSDYHVVRGGSLESTDSDEVTGTARQFVAQPARDLGFRCAYPLKLLPTSPDAPLGVGLAAIPGGLLRQGQRPEGAHDAADTPIQYVHVQPFAIQRTEVTVEAYQEFVDDQQRSAPPDPAVPAAHRKWPAVGIAQADAQAYCKWRYPRGRLPTEAEWEWAARGPSGRNYPWGELFKEKLVNASVGQKGLLKPVHSYPTGGTPQGVMDLAGSVWEWTASPASAYPGSTFQVPPGPASYVIRGGAYDSKSPAELTGMARQFASQPSPTLGFRCVVEN